MALVILLGRGRDPGIHQFDPLLVKVPCPLCGAASVPRTGVSGWDGAAPSLTRTRVSTRIPGRSEGHEQQTEKGQEQEKEKSGETLLVFILLKTPSRRL